MDKLQTQIMEYIKDYMNKTLSEGCWIQWQDWEYAKVIWNTITLWYLYKKEIRDMNPEQYKENEIKEVWHYDITAVLKYVSDYGMYIMYEIIGDEIYIWDSRSEATLNWTIPNKPLHLYTEQENESLLELLKKLNEKQNWII